MRYGERLKGGDAVSEWLKHKRNGIRAVGAASDVVSGGYRTITFNADGELISYNKSVSIEYLLVGGGGGGGSGGDNGFGGFTAGGGGGAGGLVTNVGGSLLTLPFGSYRITVGAGGLGSVRATQSTLNSGSGGYSSIANYAIAIGGGGGGSTTYFPLPTIPLSEQGRSGGSSGGHVGATNLGTDGYTRIFDGFGIQGNAGGADSDSTEGGLGGGGAGAASAVSATGAAGTAGGAGLANSITGTSVTYAGGGGGGGQGTGAVGAGGSGGGGSGGNSTTAATAGTNGLGGGGGGGGSSNNNNGGNGGNGVVIIRYAV